MTTRAEMIFTGNARSLEASAAAGATAVGRVEKSARGVGPAFAGANREVESFGKSIKHMAGLTLGTLGAAELIHGIKESINAAGDLEKQQRKVIRVFGDTPKVLEAFEKTSAKSYGISHLAALKAATSTGALLTNLGVTRDRAAGLSVGIIKLTSDIASFNGLPTANVLKSVNSALLGQTRGLKGLGISISAADVSAKALALGIVKPIKSVDGLRAATDRVRVAQEKYGLAVRDHGKQSKEALSAEAALISADHAHAKSIDGIVPKLTAQQKALATLALLYERSKVQQGDFGRNSDTLANQQKTLDAEFSNLSDRLGKDLTPAMKTFVEFMAGPGISGAGRFLTTIETDAKKVYSAVEPLAPVAHATADAFGAIAHQDGVIPTLISIGLAYKGTTLAIGAGQSIYASAAGAIGNLANPFRTVAGEAAATSTAITAFGTEAVAADAAVAGAGKGFLGLANPIAAIATVSALAVGGLVLLATTSESAGAKARKAANDFLGLVDAVNKVKSTRLDVQQATVDVSTSRQAIRTFAPTLVAARTAAHQAFPDTPAGDRAGKTAKDALNGALLRQQQLYIDLARSQGRLTAATSAASQAETSRKARLTDTSNAFDGLNRKLQQQAVSTAQFSQGPARSYVAGQQATAKAAEESARRVAASIAAEIKGHKELAPVQRRGLQAILDLITTTKQVPEKKTLSILLNDAATGKIKALKREIATLQGKTITIAQQVRGTVFQAPNPITGKAAGGIIDRPMLAILGEEAPTHPEFVIPTNPARRGHALDLIEQMRGWVPGFAGGGGPSPHIKSLEAAGIAGTPAKAAKSGSSRRGSTKKADNRPAWLKHWQDDLGSKLPGDDAFAGAQARADANLADAVRTAAKSDDVQAYHRLIKLARGRLATLHGPNLRGAHTDSGLWQTAVNTEITTVSGQLSGYQSSLHDLVKRPSVDDITINVPSGLRWAIERAGLTETPDDDIRAQKAKAAWLTKELRKTKKGSSRHTALNRELFRTNAELGSLKAAKTKAAEDAAAQADAAAGTAPDLPISVQEALADAALTTGTGDDLAALQLEKSTIEQQLAAATDPRVRVALKQALAGVNDQIAGLTATSSQPTPDQLAVTAQLEQRLAVATRSVSLSEAELGALRSSGDIGTGGFGSALQAGSGLAALIHLGDQRSLAAYASSVTQGIAAQSAIPATRERVGIA